MQDFNHSKPLDSDHFFNMTLWEYQIAKATTGYYNQELEINLQLQDILLKLSNDSINSKWNQLIKTLV